MTFLLDVNVLIALIDPGHVAHEDAHRWFEAAGRSSWATSPITENGVIRIIGSPKYPNSPGSTATVAEIVGKLRAHPGHQFWPDDISLVGSADIDAAKILTSAQVTDTYLLALAKAHGGQLATFDRKLSAVAVKGGKSSLHPIPTS
ncbi:TA system VapC family ribonuclease toxin [Chelatococcus asaccharovorans]|uniref:TA system VapC family ribonuclease toxin n=1 Tax=Chelatococcus asaccharovorans TaxID=28210 RepID=UPI00224C7580|nr:TA system VapC family ribonuclease toxin [Chelatococcus asaccharovorans]CAH1662515.1 Ribonuclease VapC44 [Chelatococcus asaccharovorans]CAH1690259.1 Ribonuclease VapC44 [Chelatococcus asaccharovorans]